MDTHFSQNSAGEKNTNSPLTLVILAAGLGSRFGGMKQVAVVGPHGEFIIDYSLYDAQQAGFERVIFVIKEENYDIFRETVGSRVSDTLKVEYAFQKMDDLPEGIKCPDGRIKPRGTGHAILAVREMIDGPFGVITADDFYGRDAFVKLANELKQPYASSPENMDYCLIGYQIKNTMSTHGTVKRGICEAKDGYLIRLGDSVISKENGKIIAEPINGEPSFEIQPEHLTSMLMFGFSPSIFPLTSESFSRFLHQHIDQLDTIEYIHPDALGEAIKKGECRIKVIDTDAIWNGVTYQDDLVEVQEAIKKLIDDGEYPEHLR